MLKVELSEEYNQSVVNEIVKQLVPILLQKFKQHELPPLLSRKEFMELAGIGESKCNELFHRCDFYPLTRELGNPKVVTNLFFEWLYEKSGRDKEFNLKYPYAAID